MHKKNLSGTFSQHCLAYANSPELLAKLGAAGT
jgi:hypothetical protein